MNVINEIKRKSKSIDKRMKYLELRKRWYAVVTIESTETDKTIHVYCGHSEVGVRNTIFRGL